MAPRTLPPYAVVDLDGVLADVRHRLHFVSRRPKDWPAFFAAASQDPVLPEGLAVANTLSQEHELVYLTGRPEFCRDDTLSWLERHRTPPGRLLMRRRRDYRPSRVAKVEALRSLARERTVSVLVDDDVQVIEAARRVGFTVLRADWMTAAEDDGGGRLVAALEAAQEDDGRT
jgi:hypothetical protein